MVLEWTAKAAADDTLLEKVTRLVEEWIGLQWKDGYLGTYGEEDRWKSWDVWVQAHNLLGLIVFFDLTGHKNSLEAAVRVADRVLRDFGPGLNSLQETGPHDGMASSAIVEPMLWLYQRTGDDRYRGFAEWIVETDWESAGPAIVSVLGEGGSVAEVADGKAAEMLIDLEGLVELYRVTEDERYLTAALRGWEEIRRHHLYITGSASVGEYFSRHHELQNDGCMLVGETCVTMNWITFSLCLGRLTGEARFFDAVEQAAYNHLLAAQSPDGKGWAYYVGLRDNKRFRWHTDPECCPTRGTRALAVLPQAAFGATPDGITVNLFEAATATLSAPDGTPVEIEVETDYPLGPTVTLRVSPQQPTAFDLRLRIPSWCSEWSVEAGDGSRGKIEERGYAVLSRTWETGDVVTAAFEMPVRYVCDEEGNGGRVAVVRGPLVFAVDRQLLSEGSLVDDVALEIDLPAIEVRPTAGSVRLCVPAATWRAAGREYWPDERYREAEALDRDSARLELVPFYEAGSYAEDSYKDGVHSHVERAATPSYQVWIPFVPTSTEKGQLDVIPR
jgi:DUF1680 family protein